METLTQSYNSERVAGTFGQTPFGLPNLPNKFGFWTPPNLGSDSNATAHPRSIIVILRARGSVSPLPVAQTLRGAMLFAAHAAALLPCVQCRGARRRLATPCVVEARVAPLLSRGSCQRKLRANAASPARVLRRPLLVVAAAAPKRAKPATTRGVQPLKGACSLSAAFSRGVDST